MGENMKTRTVVKFSLIFAVVLILFLGVFLGCSIEIANAVSPINYQSNVTNENLDWYFDEGFLNLSSVKAIVSQWFDSQDEIFDFTGLENNPIVVAVIDSGIKYNHELFQGKYDENGNAVAGSGVGEYDVFLRDEDGNIISKNTHDTSKDATDDAKDMHGTHVAGIISILIHELNLEKYIKILPIKASYPSGNGSKFTASAVRTAIDFALECGADVVNMSLSAKDSYANSDFKNMVTDVDSSKAVFVAAAGNAAEGGSNGTNSDVTKYYPAASTNVIGVTNYTYDSSNEIVLNQKSHYGSAYELSAPGSAIYSADGATDSSYKSLTGTSMASPIVAFGTALATLKYRAMKDVTLTPIEIAESVKNSYSQTITKNDRTFNVFDLSAVADLTNLNVAQIVVRSGSLNQTLGEVDAIELAFEVYPEDFQGLGSVKWYVLDSNNTKTQIATGFSINFTPDNAYSKTTIYAEWVYQDYKGSDSAIVSVEYKKLDVNNISFVKDVSGAHDGNDIFANSDKITYTIAGNENMSPTLNVFWYVNGKYTHIGPSFSFEPNESGYHRISIKISGVEIEVDEVVVKSCDELLGDEMAFESMIASICVVVICVCAMIVVGCKILYRRKKA